MWLKFRTACQDRQAGESAVESLSQGYNRMARVGFGQRPYRSRSLRFKTRSTEKPPLDHAALKSN